MMAESPESLIILTSDIVAAHVSNNSVAISDLPLLISSIHKALGQLGDPQSAPAIESEPAVSARASVRPEHVICMCCGEKMKMLKRHLRTHHDLTPDEYRAKWKLNADHPMVSLNYAEHRRALALTIGLGHSRTKAKKK